MGNQIVPFTAEGGLPAYLANTEKTPDINKDVVRAAAFPSMSIKGKVFAISKDGLRKIVTKPDEPDEVAQSIGVVVLRANMKSSILFLKRFKEGESDGQRPDCYTMDGVSPSPNASSPQSKKCATCPHRVWGSRVGDGDQEGGEKKGRACSDTGRLAIAAPDKLGEPMLLRVPPASLKNWREAVKIVDQRKIPYNAVVMKISFDPEAASPTLKFKPIGLLNDADYPVAAEMYDNDIVRAIVGADDHGSDPVTPEPPVSAEELDAAIAAKATVDKAQTPAPAPAAQAPAPAPTAAPRKAQKATPATPAELDTALGEAKPSAAPAPAATPAASPAAGDLLSDLDALLGGTDD